MYIYICIYMYLYVCEGWQQTSSRSQRTSSSSSSSWNQWDNNSTAQGWWRKDMMSDSSLAPCSAITTIWGSRLGWGYPPRAMLNTDCACNIHHALGHVGESSGGPGDAATWTVHINSKKLSLEIRTYTSTQVLRMSYAGRCPPTRP